MPSMWPNDRCRCRHLRSLRRLFQRTPVAIGLVVMLVISILYVLSQRYL